MGFFDDDDDFDVKIPEMDFDDDDWFKMEIFIPIIVIFISFCLCMCCGFLCKRKREGAIFSTPVVVTSQTHTTAAGPYPVTVQSGPGGQMQTNTSVYPMPQPHQMPPYPMGGQGGMMPGYQSQQQVPYPSNTPYSMPMPQPQQPQNMMNPPSYNEVVGNEAYQKQAPYNPNFSG